jgi:hypothetical protein
MTVLIADRDVPKLLECLSPIALADLPDLEELTGCKVIKVDIEEREFK